MSQTSLPGGRPAPATFTEAQLLAITADQHRQVVQAQATNFRATGPAILAAVTPLDLTSALVGVPSILSPDQRAARVMRGF